MPLEMEEDFLEPWFQLRIFFKFIQGALDSIQRALSGLNERMLHELGECYLERSSLTSQYCAG